MKPWGWHTRYRGHKQDEPIAIPKFLKGNIMIVVLRAVGFANGTECPFVGQYLQYFDHEANDGRGYADFTFNKDLAMKFQDMKAALQFWQKIPACRSLRDDGKPNRPMTCVTMEFLKLDKIENRKPT
jgi:hypothetical protein